MIRVGIVDDHPTFRLGLTRLLQRERDLKVAWELGSLSELQSLMASDPVDVVLMDLGLGDGEDSLAATRALVTKSRARVLFISAALDPGAVAAVRRSGASGYVPKDLPLAEVVAAVRRAAGATRRSGFTDLLAGRDGLHGHSGSVRERLTKREHEVLRELRRGFTNKEMASRLGVSVPTINKHVQKVLKKLHVRNRAAAVAIQYPE
jgi:DNA-binding NarL/FixJ family response regulator